MQFAAESDLRAAAAALMQCHRFLQPQVADRFATALQKRYGSDVETQLSEAGLKAIQLAAAANPTSIINDVV